MTTVRPAGGRQAASPAADPPSGLNRPRRRRVKIVDEIIETLRQDIVMRRLQHGARLPSERDLSQRFGVSQPTTREAIRALEMLGLVEVVHGSGTFVRSQADYALASALQTLLQIESVSVMQVLDVRHVLGRHSIEAAVLRATETDVACVSTAKERFDWPDELKDVAQVIDGIVEFQRVVSAASHNPILHALEAFLVALLNEVQMKLLAGRGLRFWRARALDFQPHREAILEGLRRRDPVEARRATDRYFDAQRALFDQDEALRSLNLSNPKLITVIANMVRQLKD